MEFKLGDYRFKMKPKAQYNSDVVWLAFIGFGIIFIGFVVVFILNVKGIV